MNRPMATKINQEPSDWRDGWTYTARQRIVDALAVVVASACFLCIFASAGALWVML